MLNPTPDFSELAGIKTLPELFKWRVAATPTAEAYRQFIAHSGQWVSRNWQQTSQRVHQFMHALAPLRLERGERVAILLPNGFNGVCMDQAALALALVPVPMHALDNPASIAYILQDSAASFLMIESDAQWKAIADVGIELPALKHVVVIDKTLPTSISSTALPVTTLEEWLVAATNQPLIVTPPEEYDLAALVYTSGTTGKPKGVMLTHSNVMSNVVAVVKRVSPSLEDVFLSFLPLSHTFERTAGYYLPIAAGACVAFSRSPKQLPQDFLEIRPTILISVPRVYERVYSAIHTELAPSVLQTWLFNCAVAVGWRRFNHQHKLEANSGSYSLLDTLAWLVLQPLVAKKLIDQFGGRLRVAVSGGAALSTSISHCFLGLGIPIVQGYGMTETSPVVAFNSPEDNDPSTVGRALAGVDVMIGENKELLVKGPNVMRGYWKREADTLKAFTAGWLKTGDQAEIDQGRIRILGRLKEIIVTSTGEKIAPVDLELAITEDNAFEQAYVFGDDLPFISCAVVLNQAYWTNLTRTLEISSVSVTSLKYPEARQLVLKRIQELTVHFPYYAQPKAVILTLDPWTVENSLMTPTLKLKRANLASFFADEIKKIYTH